LSFALPQTFLSSTRDAFQQQVVTSTLKLGLGQVSFEGFVVKQYETPQWAT
jgi:hypothetical protein